MIWFQLAFFVFSFILTALLAPEPQIENARPQTFDDVQVPQATENAPIPLILGKVRTNGPNTIWYGNFRSVPITERIRVGLFKKKTIIVGYLYFLTLDMAVGLGPECSLHEIFIDEESVYQGDTAGAEVTTVSINRGDLFGGYKSGGGWTSSGRFYSGSFTQPVNPYIENLLGAGNIPAYRGTSHITFEDANIGESVQLRRMAFVISQYTNELNLADNGRVGGPAGDDMNPAEAIYQIITDPWFGRGQPPSVLDLASFTAAGETLRQEGNGVSVLVSSANRAKQVLTEILRQIDGILYQDPDTGLIRLLLIREDYVVDDLPLYDQDDAVNVRSFTRTSWADVRGEVKVTYRNRDKESDSIAVAQDSGVIAQTGVLRTDDVTFPFLYSKDVANTLAARELSQASVPLFRFTIEFNRNAYRLRPGSVFRFSWPEYDLEQIILRVQKFDFGQLANGNMVATCLQDRFAIGATLFAPPDDSGWVDPVTNPQDILDFRVVEMPYFFANRLEFVPDDGNGLVIPLPVPPSSASTTFDFNSGNAPGNLEFLDPQEILYPTSGQLTAPYGRTEGFATGLDSTTGFTIDAVVFSDQLEAAANLTDLRDGETGILYIDGEYLGFTGLTDNGNGTFTLTNVYRGLFGSRPLDHAENARVFQVVPALYGSNFNNDLSDVGTIYYKMLDRVGSIGQGPGDVTESSFALNGVADRPLRPRLLDIGGSRATNQTITFGQLVTINWRPSNRTNFEEVRIENDAAETPDQDEFYDITVFIGGVLQPSLSQTTAVGATSAVIDFGSGALSGVGPTEDAEIRVQSRRPPGRASQTYAFIPFIWAKDNLLLSGDQQSGGDRLLLSGDQQSGTDVIVLSGDANG